MPIIATTAHAVASVRQAATDAGCDDFLTKPLSGRELLSTMARRLG